MAQIRPFRGTRYNQEFIRELNQVICPPYDIINPQQQDELYKKNQYNFVRIEYNRETFQDTPRDNRYIRAANYIEKWMKLGVLKTDPEPGLYYHRHHFVCQGKQYSRDNIIALVKLEEWETRTILPHENIIPKAKSDRMSMLKACQANTSTVLAMYSDPDQTINRALSEQESNPPIIDILDNAGERHTIKVISDLEAILRFQKEFSVQTLYIADGHHRYDSALTYCREQRAKTTGLIGVEGFNFVMMNLFASNDPGLCILPTHRLLKGVSNDILVSLKHSLKAFFDIEELSENTPNIWEKVDLLFSPGNSGCDNPKLAIYGLETDKLLILTLKSLKVLDQYMPAGHSEVYKKLDVSIVDHIILEKLIGFEKDGEGMALEYNHDRMESIRKVQDKQFQLAFILGPVNPDSIKAIADTGDRMPRKSTYFYPKAPAGLVFFKW
jgi:uncharacterized protein (DUF1015 family)